MKKTAIFYMLLCIIIIFFSTIFSAEQIQKNDEYKNPFSKIDSKADWTVMIYLAADVARRTTFIDSYLDIYKDVGSSEEFNLVALVDGLEYADTGYYYMEKDVVVPLSWYEIESDMASSKTFERFINLTKFNYPARNYALITISDYGAGWQGVFSDTHGTGFLSDLSILPIEKVGKVLKNVTNNGTEKIDVWATDVCIPGTSEVAYEISPYVDYFVANQECGGEGSLSQENNTPLDWSYSFFLNKLRDNTDIKPKNFASTIVNSYNPGTWEFKLFNVLDAPEWYPIPTFHTTLSASNLSCMNDLANSVDQLSKILIKNHSQLKEDIKKARSQVREYGNIYKKFWFIPPGIYYFLPHTKFSYDAYIDLYDFTEKLKDKTDKLDLKNACIEVMNTLNSTIIENNVLTTDPSHGLSIFFPEFPCQYKNHLHRTIFSENFKKIPSPYEDTKFAKDTCWDEFLKNYLRV